MKRKKIIIELPLDTDFKLKVIAAEKSLSPEELSAIIIEEYINKNYEKKNILRDLLK